MGGESVWRSFTACGDCNSPGFAGRPSIVHGFGEAGRTMRSEQTLQYDSGGIERNRVYPRCNERFAIPISRVVGCLADRRPEEMHGLLASLQKISCRILLEISIDMTPLFGRQKASSEPPAFGLRFASVLVGPLGKVNYDTTNLRRKVLSLLLLFAAFAHASRFANFLFSSFFFSSPPPFC